MYLRKKILAIIPARGGSKGIKFKNLRKINNLTLLEHVKKNCLDKLGDLIDCSIVSTDNYKIFKHAKSIGLNAPFLRSKKLSGDFVDINLVIDDALIKAEKIFKKNFDIIILIEPTCPLRNFINIKKMIKKLVKSTLHGVWIISKVDSKFNPLKQLQLKNNKINFFSKSGTKIFARQQLGQTYIKNGEGYAIKKKFFLKKKNIYSNKIGYILSNSPAISIDTLSDIEYCEEILKKNNK
jgi:CMP-N,N'-diacetyllegionaminic acid synthase